MLRKHGLQALVEFDSPVSASRARMALDGKDIYRDCCTLAIDYSHVYATCLWGTLTDVRIFSQVLSRIRLPSRPQR